MLTPIVTEAPLSFDTAPYSHSNYSDSPLKLLAWLYDWEELFLRGNVSLRMYKDHP